MFQNLTHRLVLPNSEADMETPLADLIKNMTTGDAWEDAAMKDCWEYIRYSKFLNIPSEFESLVKDFKLS